MLSCLRGRVLLGFATAFSAFGGLLFGYDTGVVSGAVLLLQSKGSNTGGIPGWSGDSKGPALLPGDAEVEGFVSIALAAAMVGSVAGGAIGDALGRRVAIGMAAAFFVVGSVFLALAGAMWALYVGRFVVGLAIGIAANVVPVYVAEISPARYRGALVTLNNLAITTGQFVAYLVDSAFSSRADGWRFMLGLAAVPAVLQLVGVGFVLPESPRWLVKKNKISDAYDVLERMYIPPPESPANSNEEEETRLVGSSVNNESRPLLAPSSLSSEGQFGTVASQVAREVQDIKSAVESEPSSAQGGRWAAIKFGMAQLWEPQLRSRLAVGCALQLFQQLSGINTAMYYSPTILQMSGFKSNSAAIWASNAVALANMLFTVVAVFAIDRVGRRKLLLGTMPGYILALIILGGCFYMDAHRDSVSWWNTSWGGPLSLASLVLYVAFFAIGMGPIPWTVNSELYPQNVRATANGIATFVNWGSNLVVSASFLTLIRVAGAAATFWIFAGCAAVGWVLFFFWLPETSGLSMEELQQQAAAKRRY